MTLDREALEVSDGFVYTTGKAMLNGDYDLFRSCFRLPYTVEVNNEAYTIETEDVMRGMFDQVQCYYRENDVCDLVRTVLEASFHDRDTICCTFVSKLVTTSGAVEVKPFPTFSILRRRRGVWKIESAHYAFVDGVPKLSKVYSPQPTARGSQQNGL